MQSVNFQCELVNDNRSTVLRSSAEYPNLDRFPAPGTYQTDEQIFKTVSCLCVSGCLERMKLPNGSKCRPLHLVSVSTCCSERKRNHVVQTSFNTVLTHLS